MRYSLLHRFQGTFLGSLIAANISPNRTNDPWWLRFNQGIMQRLAQTGALFPEDWSAIATPAPSEQLETGELILGTLPLIVFFYDAPSLLWEQLTTLAIKWQLSLEQLAEIMVFSRLIALIFTEELKIKTMIPQLLQDQEVAGSSFSQSLEQIAFFWQHESPFRQVIAHFTHSMPLEQSAVALGIYCFGRIPEDWVLGVRMAAQTRSGAIAALVGALEGAYNSSLGIPTPWHLRLKTTENYQVIEQTLPQFWGMWTGVSTVNGVNSPHVIQKRSSMRLISQKEYLRPSPFSSIDSTVVEEVND